MAKIETSTLAHSSSLIPLEVHVEPIFALCHWHRMQPLGIPPPKSVLVANLTAPRCTWHMRQYRKELGNEAPTQSQQTVASQKGALIVQSLLERTRGQLSAADKRALSPDWSRRSLRGAPSFRTRPSFWNKEEHVQV